MKIERLSSETHELVLRCSEPASAYESIIALHSSKLGPVGTTVDRGISSSAAAEALAERRLNGVT